MSLALLNRAKGKIITGLRLDAEKNALFLTLADGSTIEIYDGKQSCCEYRYMKTDDDLSDYVGAEVRSIDVRNGPPVEKSVHYDRRYIEEQFLIVETNKGAFTIANYNEHNGYYGGFELYAERVVA